jgi:hypothetical protein
MLKSYIQNVELIHEAGPSSSMAWAAERVARGREGGAAQAGQWPAAACGCVGSRGQHRGPAAVGSWSPCEPRTRGGARVSGTRGVAGGVARGTGGLRIGVAAT